MSVEGASNPTHIIVLGQNCATNATQFCTEGDLRIIGYERVSTARQGASGLGLEAQRHAIEGYAEQRGATIIACFTEVESGRNPDRPELGKALHLAKVTGATLVIAKLDRLSRNAAFLLTLRDSVSGDTTNWPSGDMKNWPPSMS